MTRGLVKGERYLNALKSYSEAVLTSEFVSVLIPYNSALATDLVGVKPAAMKYSVRIVDVAP